MRQILLIAILFVVTFSSCISTSKMIETGDYHGAMQALQRRLKNSNLKDKHALQLEAVYADYLQNQLAHIEQLKKEQDPANWEEIYFSYKEISEQQQLIKPNLPYFISSENRNAAVKMVDVTNEMIAAKRGVADFHYDNAISFLVTKDRMDGRRAFQELEAIDAYFFNYKNTAELKQRAKEIGVVQVGMYGVNNTRNNIATFNLFPNTKKINSTWYKYAIEPVKDELVDYELVVHVDDISVSRTFLFEDEHIEVRKIEDGYYFKKDKFGKVIVDTSGKKIQVTKYKKVEAVVRTVRQTRAADLLGEIVILDKATGGVVYSRKLNEAITFENNFVEFNGDKRALSEATRCIIGGRYLSFPTREEMIDDLLGGVRHRIKKVARSQKQVML